MARREAQLGKLSHVCAEPNQALEHGTKRGPGQSRPSTWPNKKSKHACKGVEGRAGPNPVDADAMATPRQAVQRGPRGPGGITDDSNGNPELHAAPNRSPLQEGEVVGQVSAAADAPTPVAALHALTVGSLARRLDTRPVEHACEGVHGPAGQAGPGCRGGGHELNMVTPQQEPCPDSTHTATSSRGPEPAQPGPPDVHPAANLPTAQPTAASTPPFAQATAAGSSVQPGGSPEDGATPYVSPEPSCPGTVYGSLLQAWKLQQQLLSGRHSRPESEVTIGGSHNILGLLAAPTANVDLHSRLDASMVPVICMDHDGTAASPQPPCPFLVRLRDNNIEEVLYKNPQIQWGRVLQGWQAVERVGREPGGQLVLGLRAASSGSAAPGTTSLVTAEAPPPPSHLQGQGAQLASTPGEGQAGAAETAAAPPAAPDAPPCGPEPLDGLQGGPDTALGPDAVPQAPWAEDVPWCQFDVNPRCLEELTKEQIKIFGLEGSPAMVRVVLVFPPDQPCNNDYGSLEVIYKAQRRSGEKGRWGLTIADGNRRTIRTWVEGKGLRLTGRYKAHRRPAVTEPHRLEIQVQPLPQAGIHTGQSTADADGSMNRAGPCQPNAEPAPAAGEGEAGGTAGASSGLKRKRTGGGAGQAEGAGVAEPGGATAGGGLGTGEEGGPGPSHAAAGMEGVAVEGEPVMPLPAGGPAHAGLPGSNGQGGTDPMASTQEEPGVEQEHGEWHQLITSIVSFLHAHLPDTQHQNVAKAHLRMIQWRGSSQGGVHLHALAAAHAATQSECVGQEAAHTAWFMWTAMLRLMSADVTA